MNLVTDKIPPGRVGTEGDVTAEQWIVDRDKWKMLCSYGTHDARVTAIEFRVGETLKGITCSFPEKYGGIPYGTRREHDERFSGLCRCFQSATEG